MRRTLSAVVFLASLLANLALIGADQVQARPQGMLVTPKPGVGATCTSTDGLVECKCGTFNCLGLATTCKCLSSSAPNPSSAPTSGPKLGR